MIRIKLALVTFFLLFTVVALVHPAHSALVFEEYFEDGSGGARFNHFQVTSGSPDFVSFYRIVWASNILE